MATNKSEQIAPSLYSVTGDIKDINTFSLLVKSPCGREWLVPIQKVCDDYAAFLREADNISETEAKGKADDRNFALTWFSEQYVWREVERDGVLVKQASEAEVIAALDFYRAYRAQMPGSNYSVEVTPAAQLDVPPVEQKYISPVKTVADLANNLLMMDQTLPIYGAQYIEHSTRGRCAIAVSPTVSRERVADSRWIGQGAELNAAVVWTCATQPVEVQPDRVPLPKTVEQARAMALVSTNWLQAHAPQELKAQTEQNKSFYNGCLRCNTPKKCGIYGCSPLTWPAETAAQPIAASNEPTKKP